MPARVPTLPRPAVLVAFVAVTVMIGGNMVGVRFSNRELDPFWGAASRFALGTLILAAYMVVRRIDVPRGRAFVGAMIYGLLQFGSFFGFVYWGFVEVPAAVGATVLSSVPLLTYVVAVTVRQERLGLLGVLGGALAIVGMAVMAGSGTVEGVSWWRLGAVFMAALSAAVAGVVVKGFPRSHPVATNVVGMGASTVVLAIVSLAAGESWTMPTQAATWWAFAYLVLSSALLFALIVWVIQQWTASAAAYAMVLAPLVAGPVALWLLDERMGPTFALAALIIMAGVVVGALLPGRTRPPAKDPAVTAATSRAGRRNGP